MLPYKRGYTKVGRLYSYPKLHTFYTDILESNYIQMYTTFVDVSQ